MLKVLIWLEIVLSVILLAFAVWPFSGYCSGKFMSLDCESQAIFSINMFGPFGVLCLICSLWSLNGKSVFPQYFLLFGFAVIMLYWLVSML